MRLSPSLLAAREARNLIVLGIIKQDLTQRMMLATWLVEIFLSKINQLEDIAAAERASDDVENFKAEQGLVEDDMRQFLSTYKVSICSFLLGALWH